MGGPIGRVQAFCFLVGLFGTAIGGYQCIQARIYTVAAQHESSTVGHIFKVSSGKGGTTIYHYDFSVNGVKVDDYSEVCATPLAPSACINHGPVLVYYSYHPFTNSCLEDFAVASTHAYRIGKPALAIGLPFLVLTCLDIAVLLRKDKREDDPDAEDQVG